MMRVLGDAGFQQVKDNAAVKIDSPTKMYFWLLYVCNAVENPNKEFS
jgi:hypothetical protein